MEAEKRILATLKWRRANGIDELLSTDEWELPAKLKEQHNVQLVALKGQIQPVWYIPVGTANFKGKSTILVLLFCPNLIKVANAALPVFCPINLEVKKIRFLLLQYNLLSFLKLLMRVPLLPNCATFSWSISGKKVHTLKTFSLCP